MKGPRWTIQEDNLLRNLVKQGVKCDEIAKRMGRSVSAIHNRRFKTRSILFARRKAELLPKAEQVLRDNPQITSTEGGKILGISREQFSRYRRSLGYPCLSRSQWCTIANATRRSRGRTAPVSPDGKRVLALLASGPVSAPDLAQQLGKTLSNTYCSLYRLQRRGLAFPEGKRGPAKGGKKGESGRPGCVWWSLSYWLEKYQAWIRKFAGDCAKKYGTSYDEAHQAMLETLPIQARSMRTKGFKFVTYITNGLRRSVWEYIAKERRRGLTWLPENVELPLKMGEIHENMASSRSQDEYQEEITVPPDFWHEVTRALDQRRREVVLLYHRDGMTLGFISKKLGISKARVGQLREQAIVMMRNRGTADHLQHLVAS